MALAAEAGLVRANIRRSKNGTRTFYQYAGKGPLWDSVRKLLTDVRRSKNLAVYWLEIGQKSVRLSEWSRQYRIVWCEGESPTVAKKVAEEVCERMASETAAPPQNEIEFGVIGYSS